MGSVDRALIGACGLYCGNCEILVAYTTGDLDKLEEIAEHISRQLQTEIDSDQVLCGGCHGPAEELFSMGCRIRPCADARGFVTCGECGEMGGCEILASFHRTDMGRPARVNLEKIRKVGLEKWVKGQEDEG